MIAMKKMPIILFVYYVKLNTNKNNDRYEKNAYYSVCLS